ncbi:MAG: hypothetical protein DRG33_00185 [Deltaproteobacteria bacterium]|nr:MAG: hypothetical protein DRG33_00185 [Deltaproteobacteria bacterium]
MCKKDLVFLFFLAIFSPEVKVMHVDPQKKFDVRNIERNMKEGVITEEEYRKFLEELPDASHKIYRGEDEKREDR